MQHVILISDQVMNTDLNGWNKENGTDFGFCYAPDHVVMRDFTNGIHMSMNDAYNWLIDKHMIYHDDLRETLTWLGNREHVDKYFNLYHDSSRKMYLFYWETTGDNLCPALLNQ